MRVLFCLVTFIFLTVNTVFAYDLYLPTEKKSIVNTNYAFFIGKANKSETLIINDEKVFVASNGAFAHSVKLKNGENRIVFKSNYKTQVYRFYKNEPSPAIVDELSEFDSKLYKVINDNTPLRSTPVDYGMNRISHLFQGTYLIINGKKGNFYRVFLSKNKTAWISVNAVQEACEEINPEFVTTSSENFKNASKQMIEFTEKLPYTVDETDKEIIFKVYNPIVSDNSVYTLTAEKPNKYNYSVVLEDGKYILKVNELLYSGTPLPTNLTIVVDAGHGGSEKGAIGCLGDKEKDINLKIALKLKEILANTGVNVVMTRECDSNISLEDRVKIAKENCADIFVSIHLNSIPDIKMDIHKNRGTSVYYYNNHSKNLAKSLENSLTAQLGTRKDGVKAASFAVIRPTDYIGVLIEAAYMTNPLDSVLYTSEDFPQKAAQAIADGIINYVCGN